MRILYFTRDLTTHDHRFLTALAKTDHKVYYLRLEKGLHVLEGRPLPPEIEQVEWAGGKHRLKLSDQFLLLSDLQRVMGKIKPDLVHAGPIQRSAFMVAMAGFHPLVSMSWGYDLLHDARINPFWRWATRYTLHRSDAMVGDCNTVRHLAVSYGMPDERIITFPWGVDIKHFNLPAAPRVNPSTFSILSTRGFEPIYGPDVVAHAFVRASRQDPELRLTLLGNGSQQNAIRRIYQAGGVADRVRFHGQATYAELPHFYQNADVYLSASHSDGSSISLLEAFACGTPAIVSDIPGNREWVLPGVNGWLFPDGSVEDLTSAILDAASRRNELPALGLAARRLAEEHADWDMNFPLLERAYAIALGKSSLVEAFHPGAGGSQVNQ